MKPVTALNTLFTMVRILEDKGLTGRAYCLRQVLQVLRAHGQGRVQREFPENVIGKYFGPSVFSAVSTPVKNEELSEEEIQELLEMIRKNRK